MFFPRINGWRLGLFGVCLVLGLIACGSDPSSQIQATTTPTANVPTRSTARLTYLGHHRAVNSVTWSPDDMRLASGSDDGTVQVWSAMTGSDLWSYTYGSLVLAVAWSPDGKRIAASGDGSTIAVLDAATGHLLATYGQLSSTSIVGLAWSPDGRDIASSTGGAGVDPPVRANNSVKVRDATTGQTLLTYTQQGDRNELYALAWSPDGKRIASGSNDTLVRIWEATTGHTDLIYRGHSNIILAVAWSSNSKEIASSDQNGTVEVWQSGL